MADTQTPPAPTLAAPPVALVTANWPALTPTTPQPPAEQAEPKPRAKRGRGMPMGPALAAGGNATTIAVASAYEAAGWAGLAATSGAVVLGAAGLVAKRRRTVARRSMNRAGGQQVRRPGSPGGSGAHRAGSLNLGRAGSRTGSGSGGRGSSGAGSGSRGAGSHGSRRTGSGSPLLGSGSAGSVAGRRGANQGRGGATNPASGGARSGAGSRLGRIADRLRGGTGKTSPRSDRQTKRQQRRADGRLTLGRRARQHAAAGARKTWNATRPARATAARKLAAGARHTRGAAADSLRALRAGLWGVIRHWSLRKGAQRAAEAWKRHRANRKNRSTPDTPPPLIAPTVNRPAAATAPSTSQGGTVSGGHHFVAPAMEGARAAANYQPTGMMQVIQDFAGLEEALQLHAEAMRVTVENADAKFPLDPRVVETMRQIYQLQLKASELARELQPAARKLHETDIARIETPRKGREGERMWDVTSN